MNHHLEKYASLIARLAVATVFVHGGWGKLGSLDATAGAIASQGVPAAEAGALFAASLELFGGLAIAFGIGTRWAALALAVFLVPATWFFHNPIGLEAAAAQMQWIHVYKNLAIAGGLLAFTAFGPGPLAVEARSRRPRRSGQLGFRSITQVQAES